MAAVPPALGSEALYPKSLSTSNQVQARHTENIHNQNVLNKNVAWRKFNLRVASAFVENAF
jgi:hypothetical protein